MAKRKRSTGNLWKPIAFGVVVAAVAIAWGSGGYLNFSHLNPPRATVQDVRRTQTFTPAPGSSATRTPFPTVTMYPRTYSVIGDGGGRSCPETTCSIVANFATGERITAVDWERGETIDGDNVWWVIEIDGERVYVHNALVSVQSNVLPSATRRPRHTATSAPRDTAIPVSTAAATQTWQCTGDVYNCGSFANRNELLSYFNACPGDPSKLDQDGDGVPCE